MPTAAVLFSCSYVHLSDSDAGHQGSSLSDPHKTTGFGPFKLRPVAHYRKGGTTPRLRLVLRSLALENFFFFIFIYLFIYLFIFFSVLSLHIFSLFSYVCVVPVRSVLFGRFFHQSG